MFDKLYHENVERMGLEFNLDNLSINSRYG